ncbi:MAG: ribose-phosphate pyrophosphokinase [Rickettsiales bacterium]|nr:ribose-phosphate pyrophosphokinase [Rickettsiales bacterium]
MTGLKLLSGNSNPELAKAISENLKVPLMKADVKRFADNEVWVEVQENVRGEDVFLIQSTCFPTNDNVMELLICLDALRRASAKRITAVIPYFGYARQDRKPGPRTPISAKLMANIITSAGANRVLTMDLHAAQIQGFFDIPLDNLYSLPAFVKEITDEHKDLSDVIVVSPDVGGVARARSLSKKLNDVDLAIVDKRREKAGVSEVMNIIGDVEGKHCIIFDDIADSAGTLCNAAKALKEKGAKSVKAYITHGVLSGKAVERVKNSSLEALYITDSIPLSEEGKKESKIKTISVAPLIAKGIQSIFNETSISALFD